MASHGPRYGLTCYMNSGGDRSHASFYVLRWHCSRVLHRWHFSCSSSLALCRQSHNLAILANWIQDPRQTHIISSQLSIMTKSVRFAPSPTTSFSYPRVDAADIQNVYYQEDDYQRFRFEKWLEHMRQVRTEAARRRMSRERMNKESTPRRDVMHSFGSNCRGGKVQQQGVAQAA